jgi:hypothetical protein
MNFFKKNLVEKHGVTLPFETCKTLIDKCNRNIADAVITENDGFKLPFGLGYVCAGKYIPTNPLTDWKKTKEAGKRVFHLNLHTEGFAVKAYWFRVGRITNTHFHEIYKFSAYKTLGQAISKAFGSGRMMYSEWGVSDFIEKGRLENMMNKKYRKELKE